MKQPYALLATDVVDSTKLSEALGDAAMARLWAAHDRLTRDLLPAHRGREIDKTDGFLLLFDTAADAVACALAYHRAIAALDPPLEARAAIHFGPMELTENALADVARGAKRFEVDGASRHAASRLGALARGRQTLLTVEAKDALGATSLRVVNHGWWRPRGVFEPIEVFEVGEPGSAFVAPSDGPTMYQVVRADGMWVPAKPVQFRIPTERDAFVGRDHDLQDLAARLSSGAQLVTVLGIGGTGKTRLVTRFAWTWLGDYAGGAWFCDLSEARGMDGIAQAAADALGVPLGSEDPIARLGHAIAGRGPCLVVLDNFEQVARHANDTLGVWLDRASQARFVVTTREVLGLPGETTLALAPLRPAEAIDLFVTRARQAKRDFVLTPAERPDVEALVKLLDALPLAIELAAARVRLMPPRMLLQRMSERFKLLASAGGRHTRQATLRGALDWSWDLLSPDEQQALAQLSVFEGGFTLEAAEAVLSLAEVWPMDAVQALVDKSLVRRVTEERFDLLVTVQEYAAERLVGFGGPAEAEARHGAYFATCGTEDALAALEIEGGVERRRALAAELDNLATACRRATARGDGSVAVATLRAAWAVLVLRGPFHQGLGLAEAVQAMTLDPTDRTSACRVLAGALAAVARPDDARVQLEQALALARQAGDRRTEGHVLAFLANLDRDQGHMDQGRDRFEAALAVFREVGNRSAEGVLLANLGTLHREQGRMDEARACYEAALTIHRAVGNRVALGRALGSLGLNHIEQGRIDVALAHYEEALAVTREVGDRGGEATWTTLLGNLCSELGRTDEARGRYEQALVICRELGDRRREANVLANLGNNHHGAGRLVEARAHYDAALAISREIGDRGTEGYVHGCLGGVHQEAGRPDLARASFDAALAHARAIGQPRLEGWIHQGLGELLHGQGRHGEARAEFDLGAALFRGAGDRIALVKLLCARVGVERATGEPERLAAAVEEAAAVAAEIARPGDPLWRMVDEARVALGLQV